MYDPIKMNNEEKPEKDINTRVLETLIQIEQNTRVTKGWIGFFSVLILVAVIVYLFMTLVGVEAVRNFFSGLFG